MKHFAMALFLTSILSACHSKTVSFDTIELARSTVKDNVDFNASQFRAKNLNADYRLILRGDSTQDVDCPQGDGWASVDAVPASGPTIKLKCSTYSGNLGCVTDEDFKNKPNYAGQDGKCNEGRVPFPIPKIAH